MRLMEIAVARERVPNPKSELVALIKRLVDADLAQRRHRPQPPLRAMSKRQCATAANLGISSIEAAIREGELAASKVGTRTIVLADDFERWLASRPRIKPARSAPEGFNPEFADPLTPVPKPRVRPKSVGSDREPVDADSKSAAL